MAELLFSGIKQAWQQGTTEFTCHDHSSRTLVIMFNRSQSSIGGDHTPESLYYCLFAPHTHTDTNMNADGVGFYVKKY